MTVIATPTLFAIVTFSAQQSELSPLLCPSPARTPLTTPESTTSLHMPSTSGFEIPGEPQTVDAFLGRAPPPADAERIAALLASMGILDVEYLRIFARMASRDTWLKEMRDEGAFGEIQMRVLREVLNDVGALA